MQPSITHQRGAWSSTHRSTLPRGAGYLSTLTDQSLPANRLTPFPSTFHSSALVWRGVCGVWTCMCASAVMVCGGLPLNHGGPWSPPVTPMCAVDPLSTLTSVLPSRLPSFPRSPSLVALITLHVPCPFKLATKEGLTGEEKDQSP